MIARALHLAAAFAAAALTAAGAAFFFDRSPVVAFLGFLVALAHAVVLGLPAYLVLRRRYDRLIVAILVGGGIGAVPWGLFSALSPRVSGFDSWSGGVQAFKDGVRTTAGWIDHGQFLLTLAAFGAMGGVAFWASLRISGPSVRRADVGESSRATEMALEPWSRRGWPVIPFAAAAAVLAIPVIIEDRTCHNMFRHGAEKISPVVSIDLQANLPEWPSLERLIADVSTTHNMSFRDGSRKPTETMRTLQLSACSDNGINIEVHELRFSVHDFQNVMKERGTGVILYASPEANWRPVAREVISRMEARWPGRVRFLGPEGREVARPDL